MTPRARPPTTDEFGNLILLRQALDVLVAEAEVQRGLYGEGRDAAREMAALFADAHSRTAPVFGPAFPPTVRDALEAIDCAFASDEVLEDRELDGAPWRRQREQAALASRFLPAPAGVPRAYDRQFVRAPNGRLLERRFA